MRHGLVPASPVSILAGLQEAKFLPGIKGLIGALPCPVRNTIDVFTGTGSAQATAAIRIPFVVFDNGPVSAPAGFPPAKIAQERHVAVRVGNGFLHPHIGPMKDWPP